jgi:Flp pilus assembly protein TadG
MRRLTQNRSDKERGAAGVLVAVMMLVVIGAGALAVDVGQIYAERAQLQNGADAGAIAVAQACHATGCGQAEAEAIAGALANGNSNDGDSNVSEVDLSVADQVTVRTTTQNGSNSFLSKLFAAVLNAPPATVGAHAVATVEPPSGGSGFPLAISDNCYNLSEASPTGEVQKISYKPGGTCTGPSGTQIPGGWGWLDQSSPCEATTANRHESDRVGPGQQSSRSGCAAILLDGWMNTILSGGEVKVAFPIFDDATNQGQNGQFHIIGYATFKIWGWKFGNNHDLRISQHSD